MQKYRNKTFKKGDPWVNIPEEEQRPKNKCFKGSTFGPAGTCATFNKDERNYWIEQNPNSLKKRSVRHKGSAMN